ncbi:hypothetical protein EPD60_16305 [Flaviaesturariibacter flavus]|uniref:Histidine kinase domain-containing protein n=1 Tax=Flaviaesturariibacter flavus TaxID=2502780 RepID=A0A4R1B251_9BACT|nr:GAF domain-containing protein [Flaviaesturariibacter flavus]TCJ12114.1 hypothetical protein EPD60_16305 [Flaviaesturariibacter flavus]
MDPHREPDSASKELDYYKRQLDKLTGDHLRNQYVISKLTTGIKEYTKGFQILAEVHRSFSFLKKPEVFHEQVLEAVIAHMSVDSIVLLKYDPVRQTMIPYLGKGTPAPDERMLLSHPLPARFYQEPHTLYAGLDPVMSEPVRNVRALFGQPYFILTPLFINGNCWGVLYAGRKHQVRPMFLPFSTSDVDVFEAIAGMIASLTQQLQQHDAIERERNRIAQEMHDDIGSGLTHIALLSELLQIRQQADPETLAEISKIASTSRSLTDSIGEIIWALNSQFGTLTDLLTYLREQTFPYFESFNVNYIISFPDELPDIRLNNQQRRNLYLVLKEALNNALKHSGAGRIELSLALESRRLCFRVTDNGCGIDAAKRRSSSNGLRNFARRMDHIGGSCVIESSEKGTTVAFLLPLP